MKNLIIVLSFLMFVQAEIDWANLKQRTMTVDVTLLPEIPFPSFFAEKDNKIVGGLEAGEHQFPYQAGLILSLEGGQQAFCGGSLISPNFILTAAHCVHKMKSIEVILGAHKIREDESSQIRMNSTDFIIHENYDAQWVRNDIALIKLPNSVQYNEHIQKINLPVASETRRFTGNLAVVSGWGRYTDSSQLLSSELRFINTTIIANKICFISFPFLVHLSNICTSGQDRKSACNGDSGGPLTTIIDGKTTQIGLVSFGRSSGCEKGYPAVFTRITNFLDWIAQHSDAQIATY